MEFHILKFVLTFYFRKLVHVASPHLVKTRCHTQTSNLPLPYRSSPLHTPSLRSLSRHQCSRGSSDHCLLFTSQTFQPLPVTLCHCSITLPVPCFVKCSAITNVCPSPHERWGGISLWWGRQRGQDMSETFLSLLWMSRGCSKSYFGFRLCFQDFAGSLARISQHPSYLKHFSFSSQQYQKTSLILFNVVMILLRASHVFCIITFYL